MADTEKLFNIRSQYYSSQYDKVIAVDFESAAYDVQEYILRSYLALEDYPTVLKLAGTSGKFQGFIYYVKYVQGDKSVITDLVGYAKESTGKSLVNKILATIALVKEGNLDSAIEFASEGLEFTNHDELNLEIFSLIVQTYLLQGDFNEAKSFLKKFSKLNINDSVVYSYADALVSLVKGGETANQHVFYFFEEISHSNKSLKNFVYLLTIHLILHHFPESGEILDQVDQLVASDSSLTKSEHYLTYLINKSKVLLINNDSAGASKLIDEILAYKDQSHPFIVDYKEKEQLFDEIVSKYSKASSN